MTPIGAAEVPTSPGCPPLYLMLLSYLVQLYFKKKWVYGHSMPSLWVFFWVSPNLWGILRFITSVWLHLAISHPNCTFKELGLQTPHICQDGVLLALLRASTTIYLARLEHWKGGFSVDSRPGKHTKKHGNSPLKQWVNPLFLWAILQFAKCWFTRDLERVWLLGISYCSLSTCPMI